MAVRGRRLACERGRSFIRMGDAGGAGGAAAAAAGTAAAAAFSRGEACERELRVGDAAAAFADAATLAAGAARRSCVAGEQGRESCRALERLAVRALCRQVCDGSGWHLECAWPNTCI